MFWRLRWVAFAVVSIAILGTLVAIQHYDYSHPNRGYRHSIKETENVPAAEKADDRIADYTAWLALFTGALVFVSSVQIWFLIRADRNAKTAADAALEQTKHLSSQADTMKAMQRAFIAVESAGIENIAGSGFPQISKITITNTGNIAARGIRWIVDGSIDCEDRKEIFDIKFDKIQPSTNILAPKHAMTRFTDHKFSDADVYAVERDIKVIYVWGIVFYFDGINPTERWTRFCHRYEADCFREIVAGELTHKRVRQHQFGNSTDEDNA